MTPVMAAALYILDFSNLESPINSSLSKGHGCYAEVAIATEGINLHLEGMSGLQNGSLGCGQGSQLIKTEQHGGER